MLPGSINQEYITEQTETHHLNPIQEQKARLLKIKERRRGSSSFEGQNQLKLNSNPKILTKSLSIKETNQELPLKHLKLLQTKGSSDEEIEVNSRRILDEQQKQSNIQTIFRKQQNAAKKYESIEKEIEVDFMSDRQNSKHNEEGGNSEDMIPDYFSSNQKLNESKQQVSNQKATSAEKVVPKLSLAVGNSNSARALNNQQKRKSQLQIENGNQPTERSYYVKEQMKHLVKKYLNRTQTQNIDTANLKTSTDRIQDLSKRNQVTPSVNNERTRKMSYSKVENVKDNSLNTSQEDEEDQTKIKKKFKFKIRINDNVRIKWDLFVMILSIWNCYSLPLDAAFEPAVFETRGLQIFNNVIDCCFGLDILLNFRTTYINRQTGDEITNQKAIAKEYMKGKFWIDLIATIPFDNMLQGILLGEASKKLRLLSMLKLIRVLRLSKIITYMNAADEIKLSLKLFKMLFFLIMYLHCQACLWFFLVNQDQTWIPPFSLQFISNKSFNIYTEDISTQYWASVYTSCLVLYGGDQIPVNAWQMGVLSFLFIIAAMINANILGTIAIIIQAINRRASRFQEQIDIANTAMKNMKLPESLQKTVQEFMMYTQSNLDNQKELDTFLTMISPSLRLEVTQHIFLNAISKNIIFNGNKELIDFVVHNIITLLYLPEDSIMRQGQKPHHLFFLAQGSCEVWVKDQYKRDIFVRNLYQGMLFGEISLIAQTKRTASVKSKNYCTLAALVEENFYEMCQQFPDVFFRMKQETKKYNDKWKLFQKRMISNIDYFGGLSEDLKEELHYKLSLEYFEAGTNIFCGGDNCNALYFIVDGEIDLLIDQRKTVDSTIDDQVLLDTLYTGCSIGAYSLIKQQQYPYTGRARTNLTLLVLHRQDLYEAFEYIDELSVALYDAEDFINNNGVPLCDYSLYRPLWKNNSIKLTPQEKFKNAIRRIKILNKRNKKSIKILELIDQYKAQLEKQRENEAFNSGNQSRQQSGMFRKTALTMNANNIQDPKHYLVPFIKKNIIKQLKNHTTENVMRRNESYLKALTFKIENLSENIKCQNQQMENMKAIFNSKLNSLMEGTQKESSCSQMMTDDDINNSDRIIGTERLHQGNSKVKQKYNLKEGAMSHGHNTSRDRENVHKQQQSNNELAQSFQSQQSHSKKFNSQLRPNSQYFNKMVKDLNNRQQQNQSDKLDQPKQKFINLKNESFRKIQNNNENKRGGGGLPPPLDLNRVSSTQSNSPNHHFIKVQVEELKEGDFWETGATKMNFNNQESLDTKRSETKNIKVIENFVQLNEDGGGGGGEETKKSSRGLLQLKIDSNRSRKSRTEEVKQEIITKTQQKAIPQVQKEVSFRNLLQSDNIEQTKPDSSPYQQELPNLQNNNQSLNTQATENLPLLNQITNQNRLNSDYTDFSSTLRQSIQNQNNAPTTTSLQDLVKQQSQIQQQSPLYQTKQKHSKSRRSSKDSKKSPINSQRSIKEKISYRKMSTKEINQIIEEEIKSIVGRQKKVKQGGKDSGSSNENNSHEKQHYIENDKSSLENIEEEDSYYEYYYDENYQ